MYVECMHATISKKESKCVRGERTTAYYINQDLIITCLLTLAESYFFILSYPAQLSLCILYAVDSVLDRWSLLSVCVCVCLCVCVCVCLCVCVCVCVCLIRWSTGTFYSPILYVDSQLFHYKLPGRIAKQTCLWIMERLRWRYSTIDDYGHIWRQNFRTKNSQALTSYYWLVEGI